MKTSIIHRDAITVAPENLHRYSPGGFNLFGKASLAVLLATCAGLAAASLTLAHDALARVPVGSDGVIDHASREIHAYLVAKEARLEPADCPTKDHLVWTKGVYRLYADGSVLVLHKATKGVVEAEVWDSVAQLVEVRFGGAVAYDSAEAELLSVSHTLPCGCKGALVEA